MSRPSSRLPFIPNSGGLLGGRVVKLPVKVGNSNVTASSRSCRLELRRREG
jgi:hypothetical protein